MDQHSGNLRRSGSTAVDERTAIWRAHAENIAGRISAGACDLGNEANAISDLVERVGETASASKADTNLRQTLNATESPFCVQAAALASPSGDGNRCDL